MLVRIWFAFVVLCIIVYTINMIFGKLTRGEKIRVFKTLFKLCLIAGAVSTCLFFFVQLF